MDNLILGRLEGKGTYYFIFSGVEHIDQCHSISAETMMQSKLK